MNTENRVKKRNIEFGPDNPKEYISNTEKFHTKLRKERIQKKTLENRKNFVIKEICGLILEEVKDVYNKEFNSANPDSCKAFFQSKDKGSFYNILSEYHEQRLNVLRVFNNYASQTTSADFFEVLSEDVLFLLLSLSSNQNPTISFFSLNCILNLAQFDNFDIFLSKNSSSVLSYLFKAESLELIIPCTQIYYQFTKDHIPISDLDLLQISETFCKFISDLFIHPNLASDFENEHLFNSFFAALIGLANILMKISTEKDALGEILIYFNTIEKIFEIFMLHSVDLSKIYIICLHFVGNLIKTAPMNIYSMFFNEVFFKEFMYLCSFPNIDIQRIAYVCLGNLGFGYPEHKTMFVEGICNEIIPKLSINSKHHEEISRMILVLLQNCHKEMENYMIIRQSQNILKGKLFCLVLEYLQSSNIACVLTSLKIVEVFYDVYNWIDEEIFPKVIEVIENVHIKARNGLILNNAMKVIEKITGTDVCSATLVDEVKGNFLI